MGACIPPLQLLFQQRCEQLAFHCDEQDLISRLCLPGHGQLYYLNYEKRMILSSFNILLARYLLIAEREVTNTQCSLSKHQGASSHMAHQVFMHFLSYLLPCIYPSWRLEMQSLETRPSLQKALSENNLFFRNISLPEDEQQTLTTSSEFAQRDRIIREFWVLVQQSQGLVVVTNQVSA